MRYRFIGQYTNGRTSICMNGVTFEGREPREVPAEAVARLSRNIEFEEVPEAIEPVDASKPKRGRPKKVLA